MRLGAEPGVIQLHPGEDEMVRELTGFVPVSQYGAGIVPATVEIGSVNGVRFIRSRPSLRDLALAAREQSQSIGGNGSLKTR